MANLIKNTTLPISSLYRAFLKASMKVKLGTNGVLYWKYDRCFNNIFNDVGRVYESNNENDETNADMMWWKKHTVDKGYF
ncbi:MAG: hypothetical protein WC523_04840 [Patescibacteria group bacterium]